jgi:signal transduction histidine kinase
MTYVIITFLVLLFLNIYCSSTSQTLFFRSKEATMVEQCLAVAADISQMQVLNATTVANVLEETQFPENSRLIVTNASSMVIYDSMGQASAGSYALLPEILHALAGNKAFTGNYFDSTIISRCAVPIYSYGALTGCFYMMEPDPEQGFLIFSLERNILFISIILELAVVLYSMFFSKRFTVRLRRIRNSMRIIRGGDYSHKVNVGGKDELTLLGDEFNSLTERLNASETKRRQFVSDASHELKTPLASIKLLSDSILQNDMDTDTIKEFVEDIGNEADRLNRMSSKLLSLTKIEAQVDDETEIVNMGPTVERVVRMLSTIAGENHITIIRDFRQDCPILILEDDLYQIAFNLVENGIKYNRPGGSLTVTLDRQDDMAVLEVADTGVGIPTDAISHLFERFYRVDKARSRKSGGSGLGLAIVRNMVERNGGTIDVRSEVGSGSAFTVRFPIFDTEEEI